jgi:hypothetical protein
MSVIVYKDEWWRMISAIFIHAGVFHVACNAFIQVHCSIDFLVYSQNQDISDISFEWEDT